MPKFAANLSLLFTELPFLERFGAAARCGFRGVECQFPYAWDKHAIAAELARHGLELVLHNLPAGDWGAGERGIACLPGREAEFREGVGLALDYALTLGCHRLNCLAGIAPPGLAEAELRRTMVANLRYAAAELARADVALLVEPINTRDMPGFWLNRSRPALELIAEARAPNLFLQFDAYHMQVMEGDLAHSLQANLPRIGHVQIADNPGRHEPGTGEINYRFLLPFLDRIGYTGWVGCEYHPAAGTEAGLSWMRALR